MIFINYPEPDFRFKKEDGREFIFDKIRKQWIQITDEEWVRQNFINYLITEKKYPSSLFAVEKEIKLGELSKRFDILIYDANHKPWMLIECKAPEIALDEKVLEQVLRYNMSIPCEYLIITNGSDTYGWSMGVEKVVLLKEIPEWA
jgi:hypothetical protein